MGPKSFLIPDWPAPARVRAAISSRAGGTSRGQWAGNNLALHVGDEPTAVAANRLALQTALGMDHIQWLEQVHGHKLVAACADGLTRTADGASSRTPGLACAVLTADCLPILLCDGEGHQVAALHAGWRGLAGGMVASGVAGFDAPPAELLAYLGPAIGPGHFEVGVEVLEACFALADSPALADAIAAAFAPGQRPLRFHADLYALARALLAQAGVHRVYGGGLCTFEDAERFYSYRRAAVTGRMASLIWLAD